MIYISETTDFSIQGPTAVILGKFDGLHRGHKLLVDQLMKKCQKTEYASVAFTFDIPPRYQVENVRYKQLLTPKEKKEMFEQAGLDYLIECPFTDKVRNMPPEMFIRWMAEALHIRCFIVGEDFRFGYQRAGDYVLLQESGETYGYETIVIPKIKEGDREISSTYVREEISNGNIEKANQLLDYAFFLKSEVVHGKELGRKIGIPTINMIPEDNKLLPPNGVYVTCASWRDNNCMGVTNIGRKPTVGEENPIGVETHILDFSGDLYGKEIKIEFLAGIRKEHKFSDIEELRSQVERDILRVREFQTGLCTTRNQFLSKSQL